MIETPCLHHGFSDSSRCLGNQVKNESCISSSNWWVVRVNDRIFGRFVEDFCDGSFGCLGWDVAFGGVYI